MSEKILVTRFTAKGDRFCLVVCADGRLAITHNGEMLAGYGWGLEQVEEADLALVQLASAMTTGVGEAEGNDAEPRALP